MFKFNYIRRALQVSLYAKVAFAVLVGGLVITSAVVVGSMQSVDPAGAAAANLTVSCVGNPGTLNPGGTVAWTALPVGGNGTYAYSWTGNGSFPSGAATNPVSVTYLGGAGVRNANVTVTSGDKTATASCSVTVTEPGTSGTPGAPAAPVSCAPLQYDNEITLNSLTDSASINVTNPNPASSNCSVDIGLVSYRTPVPYQGDSTRQQFLAAQTVKDSTLTTIPGGSTRTLRVSIPACEYQVDFFKGNFVPSAVQIDNAAGVQLLKWKVNSGISTIGVGCSLPPVIPPPPVVPTGPACAPLTQTVALNQSTNLSATGGNNSFSWNVSGGSPSTGTGRQFNPSFSTAGTKTVAVTSNGIPAYCTVIVTAPVVLPPPACSPLNQNARVGDTVTFNATEGDQVNFSWTASGGSPSTGTGSAFRSNFDAPGDYTATVRSNGKEATCAVHVRARQQPPSLTCSTLTPNIPMGGTANFSAAGGNGTYNWTANTGSPTFGSQQQFSASFNNSGTQTVTVTSGNESQNCTVYVQPQVQTSLSCSTPTPNQNIGNPVTFNAIGGNGTYTWNANAGSPTYGNTSNFTTQFYSQGFQSVSVSSNGQTVTCGVTIQQSYFPQLPSCSVSNPNPTIGQLVNFYGNGGTGNFSWTANDGFPNFGYGTNFNASFSTVGQHVVVMTSNGQQTQCVVNVQQTFNNAPVCTPSTQNANVGDFVTFSVPTNNNNGINNYFWSTTADGTPSTGSGTSFGARFTTPGQKIVTVNANGQSSQCVVQIGQVLGASTVDTGADDGTTVAAGLGFLGAIGAYGAVFRKNSKKLLLKVVGLVRR